MSSLCYAGKLCLLQFTWMLLWHSTLPNKSPILFWSHSQQLWPFPSSIMWSMTPQTRFRCVLMDMACYQKIWCGLKTPNLVSMGCNRTMSTTEAHSSTPMDPADPLTYQYQVSLPQRLLRLWNRKHSWSNVCSCFKCILLRCFLSSIGLCT